MRFFVLCSVLFLASALIITEGKDLRQDALYPGNLPSMICPMNYCFVNPCDRMKCSDGTKCVRVCSCIGKCQ